MLLRDLLKDIDVVKGIQGTLDIDIESVRYDSRQAASGSLFFCIKGFTVDGHDYAAEAVKNGARAVVLERDIDLPRGVTKVFTEDTRLAMGLISKAFYGHPSDSIKLIGVTGTNGKTTTTFMIKSILEQWGFKVGLVGTISNIIGGKRISSNRTTPESMDLHRIFREMRDDGADVVVMEVSSHSLELNRVAGCYFETGIFTNITQDHLDFHGTFENYRNAKAKLFDMSRVAVINVDDESGRIILSQVSIPSITYGIKSAADVYARDLEITARGVAFNLHLKDQKVPVSLSIPGIFSVYNALSAAAACFSMGIDPGKIKSGLEAVRGVPGRFELLDTGKDYYVILDYAHTPDGLENILNTARGITEGRLITLFGCGGDRDAGKRPIMGEVAGRYSDFCIITSDNPRTEDPMAIIDQIIPGIKKTACPYVVIEDRREAIKYALENGRKGDVIILAGKGHETYQLKKWKTYPFDERGIVAELLRKEKV